MYGRSAWRSPKPAPIVYVIQVFMNAMKLGIESDVLYVADPATVFENAVAKPAVDVAISASIFFLINVY